MKQNSKQLMAFLYVICLLTVTNNQCSAHLSKATQLLFEGIERLDPTQVASALCAGADVNARNHRGFAPLHIACSLHESYSFSIVQQLLTSPIIDINVKGPSL